MNSTFIQVQGAAQSQLLRFPKSYQSALNICIHRTSHIRRQAVNEPNRIDGNHSQGYIDPYKSTADIVQQQTDKRLRETYKAQQQRLRTERRINITFAICASILAFCVLIAQIYGAWKR